MESLSNFRPELARRQALTAIGAILLSGCSTLPAFGQRVRFGTVEEPAVKPPVYRDWIPDSDATDSDTTRLEYVEPAARGQQLLGAPYGGDYAKRAMDYLGIEFNQFDWIMTDLGRCVASGSIDHSRVEETIKRTGYEPFGDYRGFELYHRSDFRRTLGVGGDRLIFSSYTSDPGRPLKRIIDTGGGRLTRRHEVNTEFARILTTVGARPVTEIFEGGFPVGGVEPRLHAETFNTDGAAVYAGWAFLFPQGGDVSRSDIEHDIAEIPEALDATRVDITRDGRLAQVVAQLPPETFLEGEAVYERPFITWGADYDESAATVTVTHEAGDRIDASRLRVRIEDLTVDLDSDRAPDERFQPAPDQFDDEYDTVGPDDALTIDVGGFDKWRLRINGVSADGDHRWIEFSYRPPERVA